MTNDSLIHRLRFGVMLGFAFGALFSAPTYAEPPDALYIFPAGAQRGTTVPVRIGGCYLHEQGRLEVHGAGVSAPKTISPTKTIWFEGPLIRQPASQQREDYPKDYAAEFQVSPDAPLGSVSWRVWNAQGASRSRPFVIGPFPEVVEQEIDGEPLPVDVQLPVTINGRIFPREDSDLWRFQVPAGTSVTCSVDAAKLGSPLQARLEVRDSHGQIVAESQSGVELDPQLRFLATQGGDYSVLIHDVRNEGLQPFVYRLTVTAGPWIDSLYPAGGQAGKKTVFKGMGQGIESAQLTSLLPKQEPGFLTQVFSVGHQTTNAVRLWVDEFPETREVEPNPTVEQASPAVSPGVMNGRIESPGDIDFWKLELPAGQAVELELMASRLGSLLDAQLVITDSKGQELMKAQEVSQGTWDAQATFLPPAAGVYFASVSDRFKSRGGSYFAYRLRVRPAQPDFNLEVPNEVITVDVGTQKKLAVKVDRRQGYKAPITVEVQGLPAGVSVTPLTIAEGQNQGELNFTVEKDALVAGTPITVIGKGQVGELTVTRQAHVKSNENIVSDPELFFVSTLATPFKHKGGFSLQYISRGTPLRKPYQIDRQGFTGPIRVELADKQGRHLQGVTYEPLIVPEGQDTFDYGVLLAPGMELGRTCRVQLMISGEITQADGQKHRVTYTSNDQNDQLIALVSPSPLRLGLDKGTLLAAPGHEIVLPVNVLRETSLQSPVHLELVVPPHIHGVEGPAMEVQPGTTRVDFKLRFGPEAGPWNQPLLLRASATYRNQPITTEYPLQIVQP